MPSLARPGGVGYGAMVGLVSFMSSGYSHSLNIPVSYSKGVATRLGTHNNLLRNLAGAINSHSVKSPPRVLLRQYKDAYVAYSLGNWQWERSISPIPLGVISFKLCCFGMKINCQRRSGHEGYYTTQGETHNSTGLTRLCRLQSSQTDKATQLNCRGPAFHWTCPSLNLGEVGQQTTCDLGRSGHLSQDRRQIDYRIRKRTRQEVERQVPSQRTWKFGKLNSVTEQTASCLYRVTAATGIRRMRVDLVLQVLLKSHSPSISQLTPSDRIVVHSITDFCHRSVYIV
ncbi:hypothetical protein RRG08_003574 [Elysia crispata]|uniref:Uncharacterized protein n=1 Tax=Elysia crispata TaxID=231223 RepID=A0AAE0YIL3_9GAST|nr:hypothetical protein RRG08_003574 [Elysia crispata]